MSYRESITHLQCRLASRLDKDLKEDLEATLFPLKWLKTSGQPREFATIYISIFRPNYLITSTGNCLITSRYSNPQTEKVVIKTAPTERFENERNVLKHFQGRPYIRQMLDEINNPASMVLKHLDSNLLDVSAEKPIEALDVKFVAKRILQALHALHEDGYTHTGKPQYFEDRTILIFYFILNRYQT